MTDTDVETGSSSASTPTDAPATSIRTWIGHGWSITRRHPLWTLFPLVTGLLSIVPVVRALGHEGVSVNPTATFPGPVVDLWPLFGIRLDGLGAIGSVSAAVLLSLPTIVTVLFAGAYLGTLNDLLDHRRPSLWRNLTQYGVPIGLYTLLWEGAVGLVFVLTAISLPLGAVAFVAFLLVTYRVWSTPFLVVVTDQSLLAAFGRAWQLSSGSGPYRQFSLAVLGTTLLLSVPRVYGVLAARPAVLVASVVLFAPVAMLLTVASLAFVRSLVAEADRPESAAE